MGAAERTTSNAEPGISLSWFRSSSFQRRSEVPEKDQLDPLSATIIP
jgi:hypothetical protein